ncbi:energy-coupling factor ABC transporter ATP-binding protein [Stetteria hydrogenophila]
MIRLEGVWFRYPRSGWVLRGVSLELPGRGATVILGPNGSGKTTLLKVAGLIYKPARGRVEAWGVDAWSGDGRARAEARRRVVYVHEKPIMLKGSVLDNIAYGLRLRGIPRDEALERARRAASLLGIEGLLDKPAKRLSAGQGQLVAIARALAVEPGILLLDEPTANLDWRARRRVIELLEDLKGRIGVVIATHDHHLAGKLADRLIIVEEGKAREATPSELELL